MIYEYLNILILGDFYKIGNIRILTILIILLLTNYSTTLSQNIESISNITCVNEHKGSYDLNDNGMTYRIKTDTKNSYAYLYKNSKVLLSFEYYYMIDKIGFVKYNGDNYFFVVSFSGASAIYTTIHVIDPRNNTFTFLGFSSPYYNIPELDFNIDYYSDRNKVLATILDSLKYVFGYFDKEVLMNNRQNPRFIFENWILDNDNIEYGEMKINRLKGFYESEASQTDEIKTDSLIIRSYFKGGTVINDLINNEYFVIYAPHNYFDWSDNILRYNNYLIMIKVHNIQAIVNINTYALIRFNELNFEQCVEIDNGKLILDKTKFYKLLF